jgi:hypothetical protein
MEVRIGKPMTIQPFSTQMQPTIAQYMAVFHPHAMKRLLALAAARLADDG